MHWLRYFAIFLLACRASSQSTDRQSPVILNDTIREDCQHLEKQCCNHNHPCCCSRKVCTRMDCMNFTFPPEGPPEGPPETAFFKFTGLEPGAPCCGPNCAPNQCLELLKLQLLAIEDPLRAQRDSLKTTPHEIDCCGEGCSVRGCFSDILQNLIQLQSPIQNTQRAGIEGMEP
jgi:hypothetical protein